MRRLSILSISLLLVIPALASGQEPVILKLRPYIFHR